MNSIRWLFARRCITSIEELQADLDQWLEEYNRERSYSGKYCEGRTPLQTFRESKHLAYQKMLERQFEAKERDVETDSINMIPVVG